MGPSWFELICFPSAGLLALSVLAYRRLLRPGSLEGCPARPVGLGLPDLAVAVCLMLAGSAAAGAVLEYLGWLPEAAENGAGGDSGEVFRSETEILRYTGRALVSQAMVHLPVVIFLVWKTLLFEEDGRPEGQPAVSGPNALGLWPKRPVREAVAAGGALAAAIPMVLGLNTLLIWFGVAIGVPAPEVGHELLLAVKSSRHVWATVGLVGSAVVAAPLLEECIFRGLVQTALLNTFGGSRRWLVVVVAGGVFSLIHVGQPWQVLPSLFVLGMVLGWLYERTGSLWPGVLVHAGFNLFNVLLMLWVT